MDILQRYLGYETWTLLYFITRCSDVSPEQLHQQFDMGQGTLYETIAHIISNLEVWTDLMRERPVRDLAPVPQAINACLQRFDAAMLDFADYTGLLAAEGRLDDSYLDVLDKPPKPKSFGGTIPHLLTHTTVHRLGNAAHVAASWRQRSDRRRCP